MKVKETNLGGGVVRLEVVPTFLGERIPTHVADLVMRDVVEKNGHREVRVERPTRNCGFGVNVTNRCVGNTRLTERQRAELAWRDTDREPDGIDIHVDRPRQENFWSRKAWAEAMAKYRTLEDAARDCDWECREPMKGTTMREEPVCRCNTRWEDEWEDDDLDWEDEVETIPSDLCCRSASVSDYLRFI